MVQRTSAGTRGVIAARNAVAAVVREPRVRVGDGAGGQSQRCRRADISDHRAISRRRPVVR